jgi:hypothetical protein
LPHPSEEIALIFEKEKNFAGGSRFSLQAFRLSGGLQFLGGGIGMKLALNRWFEMNNRPS